MSGGSTACTVRFSHFSGTRDKGPISEGAAVFSAVSDSLVAGNRFEGLRNILLSCEVEGMVFIGNRSSAAVVFDDSRSVQHNLFERNTIWTAPGHHWAPFSNDLEPLGPGNLLYRNRQWWYGSQGGIRQDVVYRLNEHPLRAGFNDYWDRWQRKKFVQPIGLMAEDGSRSTPSYPTIAADGGDPDDPIVPLHDGAWVLDWRMAAGLPSDVYADITSHTVVDSWTDFDVNAVSNGRINALALADRNTTVLLSTTISLASAQVMQVKMEGKAPWKLWISGEAFDSTSDILHMDAGQHRVFVAISTKASNPFVKSMDIRLSFSVHLGSEQISEDDFAARPPPESATLYPVSGFLPELRGETEADAEITTLLRRIYDPEWPLLPHLQAVLHQHPGTFAAWLAARIEPIVQSIENEAKSIDDELERWFFRSRKYFRSGLVDRAWTIEKLIRKGYPKHGREWRVEPQGAVTVAGMAMMNLVAGRTIGWVPVTDEPLRGVVWLNGGEALDVADWLDFATYHNFGVIRSAMYRDKLTYKDEYGELYGDGKWRYIRTAMGLLGERTGHPELINGAIVAQGYSRFSGGASNIERAIPNPVVAYACGFGPGKSERAREIIPNIKIAVECEDLYDNRAATRVLDPQWTRASKLLRSFAIIWRMWHGQDSWTDNGIPFFHRMIERRVPAGWDPRAGLPELKPIQEEDGWLGSHETFLKDRKLSIHENARIQPFASFSGDKSAASWLPDEYTAWVWHSYVSRNPIIRITAPSTSWSRHRFSHAGLDIHAGDAVEFKAELLGSAIASVEFYLGTEHLGTVTEFTGGALGAGSTRGATASLRAIVPAGVHAVMVKAVESNGAERWSMPAPLIVYP
jgi:hypothetical protein